MKTVLTNCPHCHTRQLADEVSVGLRVVCARCQEVFTCEADSEPLQWVRSAMNKGNGTGFEKYVSRILFSYGIAVPLEKQDAIIGHMGVEMSTGCSVPAIITIGGREYEVELSMFTNKKGEPALHFKWQRIPQVEEALRQIFPDAYEYYVVKQEKRFLTGVVVEVGLCEKVGLFWLRRRSVESTTITTTHGMRHREEKRSLNKNLSELLSE